MWCSHQIQKNGDIQRDQSGYRKNTEAVSVHQFSVWNLTVMHLYHVLPQTGHLYSLSELEVHTVI